MTIPFSTGTFPASAATDAARSPGLEGVVAADTILSEVDGARGRLILRGRAIEDLAGQMSFEAAVAFFWQGLLPLPSSGNLAAAFAEARLKAHAIAVPVMQSAGPGLGSYERMRLGLAALCRDDAAEDALTMTGAMPVLLAAAARIGRGESPVAPSVAAGSASDLLAMLTGTEPSARAVAAIDRYLVTILDHGFNASTFTARVIASTGADMGSAVLGAMGALKGPLHGGAPGPVLDMLDAIGTPERAAGWISAALAKGDRLMGFGHRIYRQRDPRADVLKAGLGQLEAADGRVALAEVVEREATEALARHKPGRPLHTNVEFYTAVLLEAAGIDRSLFTPLFATGRVAGWCAHVAEQRATGRLIRPGARYVGPQPAA